MKKCLHLKKTKPHWRRKPPKVMTRREKLEAERRERQRLYLRENIGAVMVMGAVCGIGAIAALSALHAPPEKAERMSRKR